MGSDFRIEILRQPDDSTCGPTCLHAVYRHFGDDLALDRIISEIPPLDTGGTLAVHLALHALRRGYGARMYTYNLNVFDPTWFNESPRRLPGRLREQAARKDDDKLKLATEAYLEYLHLGGEIRFEELTFALLRKFLDRQRPILTGLSATYLYRCARESGSREIRADSVGGHPVGHFVVLYGYDHGRREVRVADPYLESEEFNSQHYELSVQRVMNSILLGVLTYDANLLILTPPAESTD